MCGDVQYSSPLKTVPAEEKAKEQKNIFELIVVSVVQNLMKIIKL